MLLNLSRDRSSKAFNFPALREAHGLFLSIAKSEATELAQNIYSELASISNSPYVSTGGDEVNMPCYELPEVSDLLQKEGTTIEEALKTYSTLGSLLHFKPAWLMQGLQLKPFTVLCGRTTRRQLFGKSKSLITTSELPGQTRR